LICAFLVIAKLSRVRLCACCQVDAAADVLLPSR
jgi:hypothetical protein